MLKYHESDIRNIALVGHRAAARPRWPTPSCTRPTPSIAWAAWTTAPASPTSTTRSTSTTSPSTPASSTSSTRASTSTSSTPPATPTSSAPPSSALHAVETAVDRRLGRQRHRGQHPPHVQRGRQARPGPACSSSTSSTPRTSTSPSWSTPSSETFGKELRAVQRPRSASAPNFSGVVSVLDPPAKTPAGCPVDLDDGPLAARRRRRRGRRGADGEVPRPRATVTVDGTGAPACPRRWTAGTVIPIFCTVGEEGHRRHRTARRAAHATACRRRTRKRARTACKAAATSTDVELKPTEQGEFVGQVFKTVNDKFVGNLSFIRVSPGKLHARPRRSSTCAPASGSRVGGLLHDAGQDQTAGPRGRSPATSSPSPRSRTCTSATRSASRNARRRSCRRRTFPTPMFGLAVEPKTRGDEQKISGSLHKIADEDPTFKVDARPADARTGHHRHEPAAPGRDPAAAEAAVRPGGRSRTSRRSRTARRSPRDGEGRPPAQEADRRPRAVRRGPPARLPAAARDQDAGAASRRVRQQVASSRRCGACHYDPEHNFAFIDHIVGGTIPNQFIPAVEKGCKELLERGRLAGYRIQDVRRRGLLRQVPRRGQLGSGVQDGRPACAFKKAVPGGPPGAAGADREAGGDGAVEVHRGDPRRPEHQAGAASRTRTACRATWR